MPSPSLPERVVRRFVAALIGLPVDAGVWIRSLISKTKLDARKMEANIRVLSKADDDEDIRAVCRYLDYSFDSFSSPSSALERILKDIDLALRLGTIKDFEKLLNLGRLDDYYEFQSLKRLAAVDLSRALETMKEWETPLEVVRAYKETVELAGGIVVRIEQMEKRILGAKNLKAEKVEKLYHASCNARDLYKSGFKQARPEGGMGLGGSVADKANNPAISFTHDLRYALQIARWFKEMAMVASGDIKASQIFRLAEQDGVADKVLQFASGMVGTIGDLYDEGGQVRLDHRNNKLRVVRTYFKDKELVTEVEDPDVLFKDKRYLYDLYVSYVLQSPHRSNPVSMNATQTLELMERNKVSPRDIGVITAEVDMGDPDIEYIPAEAEYRVPPRAILKVLKFLGE